MLRVKVISGGFFLVFLFFRGGGVYLFVVVLYDIIEVGVLFLLKNRLIKMFIYRSGVVL